jgi:hypothetical protein
MSMILAMVTLGDANISRVLQDPPLIWRVIAPDDPEPYESARRSAAKPSFLRRLFGGSSAEPKAGTSAESFALGAGEGMVTDLDKAWHGIHYLLTGTAAEGRKPLDFLVSGGREVGNLDVGYGPARVFSAAETRAAHEALARLGDDELRGRFNPEDMTRQDIYPEIWNNDPEEDDPLGYVMEYLGTLRGFLAQAVEHGHGLVVYLT